jgi:hypothetical protein
VEGLLDDRDGLGDLGGLDDGVGGGLGSGSGRAGALPGVVRVVRVFDVVRDSADDVCLFC